jgi:uncharacterized membrane protein YfcA
VIVALVLLGVGIGLTLGALGAGGSILAVPVLVHVAGLSATAATATSLVAVGTAAAVAAVGHRHQVRFDVAWWFIPTGFVGALAGARIGDRLDGDVLLVGFSALMLVAATRMLAASPAPRSLSAAVHPAPSRPAVANRSRTKETAAVAVAGVAVGLLTGLFGVGGGFVIVPALTLAVGLAMPAAVATSLVIVAANAALALAIRGPSSVDWAIAVSLTIPMLVGSLAGTRLARRLDPGRSRRAFALLLVAVAVANALAIVV